MDKKIPEGIKRPEVSIIVPVYNAADTLERSIRTIFEQTVKNIEVIFINDGSTDGSLEILERISSGEERIKLVGQDNRGPGMARNRGLDHATGRYLYFVDADDKIEAHLLEENLALANKKNADIVIFGYRKAEKLATGQIEVRDTDLKQMTLKGTEEIKSEICNVLSDGATFAVWNKLFKRSAIHKNGVKFPEMRRNEDISFTMDAIRISNSITVNPTIYYHYYSEINSGKYDSSLIKQHLYVFDKFYTLFDGWMQISQNFRYATKLFVLYFFHSIPFFVVKYDHQPSQKLEELYRDDLFLSYLEIFKPRKAKGKAIKGALFIMHAGKPGLLGLVTKLKVWFTEIFGKNSLRNLLRSN